MIDMKKTLLKNVVTGATVAIAGVASSKGFDILSKKAAKENNGIKIRELERRVRFLEEKCLQSAGGAAGVTAGGRRAGTG